MAPNIQHQHIHLLSADPRPRSVITGVLTVKLAPAVVGKDYQRSIPVADSATYWLWEESSPAKDLFLAEHIITTAAVRSVTAPSDAVLPTHQRPPVTAIGPKILPLLPHHRHRPTTGTNAAAAVRSKHTIGPRPRRPATLAAATMMMMMMTRRRRRLVYSSSPCRTTTTGMK
jgi:hypothetical protein